ncbi:hypothetical protein BN874_1320014 [Candidatus Contendobacter odensis Run_B_J11]|uniref:Uncharacterized protein n=1 Tax=Candidatus Contendobacter odensis Run_B_J11 TaxID=1400861 RepID=A0A7U7J1P8_9GAMM|nr:hypothetical protein BN874_1320014 [Candidatus Contendobacter odensis Run_B_J11]
MEHLRRYVDRPTEETGGDQNVYRPKLRVVKGGLSD